MSETDSLRDWLGVMFAQVGERFDAVEGQVRSVEGQVRELRSDMSDRFDRLEGRVQEVAAVNGTLIDEVARINARLGRQD